LPTASPAAQAAFDYLAPVLRSLTPLLGQPGGVNPSAGENPFTQLVQSNGLRGTASDHLGLLLFWCGGDLHPCGQASIRVAFEDSIPAGRPADRLPLDIVHPRRILRPSACSALGILAVHQRFDHLQLLTAAIPHSKISKERNEGDAGLRKIAQITRYVALGLGRAAKHVFALILRSTPCRGTEPVFVDSDRPGPYHHGSMVVMWIS